MIHSDYTCVPKIGKFGDLTLKQYLPLNFFNGKNGHRLQFARNSCRYLHLFPCATTIFTIAERYIKRWPVSLWNEAGDLFFIINTLSWVATAVNILSTAVVLLGRYALTSFSATTHPLQPSTTSPTTLLIHNTTLFPPLDSSNFAVVSTYTQPSNGNFTLFATILISSPSHIPTDFTKKDPSGNKYRQNRSKQNNLDQIYLFLPRVIFY